MPLNTEILAQAATQARGLAIDAVHKAGIGHLGLPLGCAEIGAVLYGNALQHNPANPRWLNRDRFVLSAGHGSMFLYAWLHLSGYDLTIDDVKAFRSLHSRTPGHPESFETPGVEATTGPLGQGVGNAVGMAMSGKMLEARFNTPEHPIFDYRVVCLAGDGCMQEGVAQEAVSFAGHQGLDNLILIYDANDVTLDAMADRTQSDDAVKRFKALGWDVTLVADGHDMNAFLKAFNKARRAKSGKPQLIVVKTTIAKGIPEVAGTAAGHGEGGAKHAASAKAGLGLQPDVYFHVGDEVRDYFAGHKKRLIRVARRWEKRFQAWKEAHPEKAALLESRQTPSGETELLGRIPEFPADKAMATRAAGGDVLQQVAEALPLVISGSADLHGSTKNYIKSSGDWDKSDRGARNIRFGIREHAMAAMCNGIAYDGIFHASCATFMVFADYARPSMRLAGLSRLPVVYIYTHDSVGVGEDGPTHQPVETISSVRLIPHFEVFRPGDPEETAAAFAAAFARTKGPTLLALTRQNLPNLSQIPVADRRNGTLRGGYIAIREAGELTHIVIATGSELQHAVAAAKDLGPGVRVVSMPSMERFAAQPREYQDEVLPKVCEKRVAIEAGVPHLWSKYVGPKGRIIGIERFGLSAPYQDVMKELGITAEAVRTAVESLG